jgi:hypothetical protein
MPKGPQGQKRPADVIRNIVQVMRIATSLTDRLWGIGDIVKLIKEWETASAQAA